MSFFSNLPVKIVIKVYAIYPIPIPFAIEYVRGIIISVRNAGAAYLMSDISTFLKFPNISTPTYIKAGAVAQLGTMLASGVRNRHTKKHADTTRLVSPVLPPAATPDADSTKVVHVEVPNTAPVTVAIFAAPALS